jgi:hypothetical protein
MTDTPEPAAEGDSLIAAPSAQADPAATRQRRSPWTRLNRTNRIAAVVLGVVAAVFVAVLIFGAGLLVGAEYGDSEGHHDGAGSSEYGDGDRASGEHEGDEGASAGDGDREGSEEADSESGQGARDEQAQPDAPHGQAPGESNGPPRP